MDTTHMDRFFLSLPQACLVVHLDGQVIAGNPAWERVLGGASGDARVSSLDAVLHPEDRPRFREALQQLAAGQEAVVFDARVVRPGRADVWLEWSAVSFPEEQKVRLVAHDATARRTAELAARESARSVEALLNNLPGFVYRCINDADWTTSYASAGFQTLTGHSPEDLLSKRVTFSALIHPEDRQHVWDEVQAALDTRTPFLIDYRIVNASGEVLHVSERGRGVYDDAGQVLALEGFMMDVTERVLTEENLREKTRIIDEQQQEIRNLSLPIIEVWDGVVTLPIVGTLDEHRAAQLTEGLLQTVVQRQSRHVILDLTAVGSTDATIAHHLARILRAVELLGARGILVGIQPGLAQSFVELNTNLSSVVTLPNLRTALLACMQGATPRARRSDSKPASSDRVRR
ncbi:uncharacterized protein SOCE26_074530 [Sorangium cellulosum]|uniref:Anti-anti-sigma factor n=1 Tax=Sorangium cellulosum TaxID=56 RepID=A0A2L0F372_SORCE|nr:PAS domain-containing protein [Sorangium cellulosum]AUX45951.1 uncharacterized protein SOCE26_074530 [Sorangium cellulosum]